MKSLNRFTTCLLMSVVMLAGVSLLRADDKPATKPDTKPADAAANTDLKLFDKGAEWKFTKNTGEGSFQLSTDGDKPIGVLNFDFSKKVTDKTAYVLASAKVTIPDTAGQFQMMVRSTVAKKLTLRFVDDTGQTLQIKGSVSASGAWEPVKFSLAKKMEHWDGANDGKVHFPIKSFVISLPEPAGDTKTGKIEFSDAVTIAK